MPWGMSEERFVEQLVTQWPRVLKQHGLPENIALDSVGLDTVGDGRYAVTSGTGPLRDKNGNPVVITVSP